MFMTIKRPPIGGLFVTDTDVLVSHCHAYFRKYTRFVRLDTLGFKTPYFRDLPSKKDYQSFFSLAYRLRLAQSVRVRER